jgi:DNA processing protein
MNRQKASWWLSQVPGWGAVRIGQLLEIFESPEAIYEEVRQAVCRHQEADRFWQQIHNRAVLQVFQGKGQPERWHIMKNNVSELMKAVSDYPRLSENYDRWIEGGGGFVTALEPEYPKRLLPYTDRPFALYYKGRLPQENRGTAAVVGARACSFYGRKYARIYARELAENGVQIISGLACGIDSEGHAGALESGIRGCTYAVLGCGPDICYPKEEEPVYERILSQGGGILSEYAPGTTPMPRYFPMRNRIISGLADCVLVMEARKRSGSLITVDLALDQGKEIFALPGRVGDGLSEGCLQLIRNGAGILTNCEDVLDFINGLPGMEKGENTTISQKGEERDVTEQSPCTLENPAAPSARKMILELLDTGEKNIDALVAQTGFPLSNIQQEILELLLEDQIEEISVGCYVRKNLRP